MPADQDLKKRLEGLAQQAQAAATTAVKKAGAVADDKREDIEKLLDKTGATVDQRTQGKFAAQIDKVKSTLNKGVAKLADQSDAKTKPTDPITPDPINPDDLTPDDPAR